MSSDSLVTRRSFISDTLKSAELDAKLELGDNFDIIDSQEIVETFFLGLFSKKKYKLTVQYPSKKSLRKRIGKTKAKKDDALENMQKFLKNYNKRSGRSQRPTRENLKEGNLNLIKDIMSEMDFDKQDVSTIKKKDVYSKTPGKKKNEKVKKVDFQSENKDDRHYQTLTQEIAALRKELSTFAKSGKAKINGRYSEHRKGFYDLFVENDMPALFANKILESFEKKLTQDELEDFTLYRKKIREFVIDRIYFRPGIEAQQGAKIALFGPTGVGKTTTVAKLAYHYKYEQEKEVIVISLDSYKYGGIMQLEDLCNEMGVEFHPVYDEEELKSYMEKNDDKIMIVDTAGQNYSRERGSKEIKKIIEHTEGFERYLVLSSKMKYNDMMRLNDSFSAGNIKGVIFSKCDLCKYVGTVIAFLCTSKNNLVYLTFGKKITGDLREAVPYRLVDGILKDEA